MQWLRKKVVAPILDQLKQGADPACLAWSVSLGAALGVFPVLGSTMLLCGLAGAAFGLNHVAMQATNYLVYAAQIALIPVFIRGGEWLTGATPIPIDLSAMKTLFMESPQAFFTQFGLAALHGILAWLVAMPLPTWALARLLERQFRRVRGGASNP